jgi:Abnormal spindle-like microcephaly-assoc'd, ASPM-SPD-2-Hydin
MRDVAQGHLNTPEPPLMSRRSVIAVFAILSLSLFVGSAWAGPNTWTGGGPTGAAIRAVLVDPLTPSTIYVGTVGSGVFKSINNGATWTKLVDASGTLATRTIRAIVISATGTLYAGADNGVGAPIGVFQSDDGGVSWVSIGTQALGLLNRKVQSLLVDGTILYAGTREEPGVPGGMFKWNGTSWTQINTGLPNQSARRVQALAVDTRPAVHVIYAGTQGEGVFKTFDGGANWQRVDNPALPNQGFKSDCLLSPEILALQVDESVAAPAGTKDATLYVGATGAISSTASCAAPAARGAGFFRFSPASPPAFGEWDRKMNGAFQVLVPTTLSTQVWAIAMKTDVIPPRLYIGTDHGVFTSNDGGGNWDGVPRIDLPDNLIGLPIRALGMDPAAGVTLYAGSNGRGMFKRSPNIPVGEHPWAPINAGLTVIRAQAAAVGLRGGSKVVLEGLSGGGVVTSTAVSIAFETPDWQDTSETDRTVLSIATDPTNASTVYAATGSGVLKSTDGGNSWTPASVGLPTLISQDPNNPPAPSVRSISVDPADPNTLYAAVGGVYRSANGGTTWTSANGNLPSSVTTGARTVTAIVIDHVSDDVDPTWGNLYVATLGAGVFRSINGGVTWNKIEANMPPEDLSVVALALDPLPPATLYAGTSTGKVYKRVIGVSPWAQFGTLPGQPVTGLAVKLGQPSKIYAGLNGGGVYVARADTAQWTAVSGLSSRNIGGLGFDPEGTNGLHAGTLYAATLGGGTFGFDFDNGPNPPVVNITSPAPPTFTTGTSPVQISGTGSASSVFWSTNRGHAGLARVETGTGDWSASVLLEPGPNVITVTAVASDFSQRSRVIEGTLLEQSGPVIFVSPLSVPFGTVSVGGVSALQVVTVRNDGTANLILGALALGGANPRQFKKAALQDLCSGVTLAPTQACTVGLKFKPKSTGAKNATLTIPSNDPVTGLVTVTLSGTGNGGGPVIFVNPQSVPFGTVAVGGVSSLQNVTVRNDGTANLVLGVLAVAGANPDQFKKAALQDLCTGVTLAPTQSCTVGLKFKPTSGGAQNATLTIPSNDPVTSLVTVTLSGTGGGPEIFVSPLTVPFGTVQVGGVSSLQNVTVRNDGTANLILGSLGLGGANSDQFKKAALQDLCSGVTLGPTQTCTVGIKFKPTSTGPKSATLVIPSNDFDEPSVTVMLSGTGQ